MKRSTMQDRQFLVNEETLTDGSKVYDVVGFDGNDRITLNAIDKGHAEEIADMLNYGLSGFSVDSLK